MRPLALLLLLTTPALAQIGPDFMKPTTSFPANYKGPVWREGRPLDNTSRGEWWKVFKDEKLNSLMARATAGNQQLKAAIARFDQARVGYCADLGGHAVVAQPAGVDRIGHEVVAEGVHLHERGEAGAVAEVVLVHAAGE